MTVTDYNPFSWKVPDHNDLECVDPSDPLAAGLGWAHNFSSSGGAAYNTEVLSGMSVVMRNGDGWPALLRRTVGSGQLIWFNGRTSKYFLDHTDGRTGTFSLDIPDDDCKNGSLTPVIYLPKGHAEQDREKANQIIEMLQCAWAKGWRMDFFVFGSKPVLHAQWGFPTDKWRSWHKKVGEG